MTIIYARILIDVKQRKEGNKDARSGNHPLTKVRDKHESPVGMPDHRVRTWIVPWV